MNFKEQIADFLEYQKEKAILAERHPHYLLDYTIGNLIEDNLDLFGYNKYDSSVDIYIAEYGDSHVECQLDDYHDFKKINIPHEFFENPEEYRRKIDLAKKEKREKLAAEEKAKKDKEREERELKEFERLKAKFQS